MLARLFLLWGAFALPASAAIVVDGVPDEPEWQQARVFGDLRRTQPYTLDTASVETQVRMLATPEGLAFAFRCAQDPSLPRVKPFTPRDRISSADRVNIMIDFDADAKTAYNFTVSLSNSIEDAVITEENNFNADWDADWAHAVHEDDAGWAVEIVLPWTIATMRDSAADKRTVAVYFDRVLASRSERSAVPAIFYGNPVFLSAFEKVEIPQYRSQILDFFPYVSALYDVKNDRQEFRGGMDMFWKPSGDFQLTAALNPDFGQVESDELVVNFDAIETFYSDKRPFFTENQGLFDLRTPQGGRILYTRRVGGPSDDDSGRAADIDAAVKLNGNAGRLKYGLFLADEADDAGRQFTAARLLYTPDTVGVGLLVTDVERPALDRHATVSTTDLRWQPNERFQLNGQILLSDVESGDQSSEGAGAWIGAAFTPSARWHHEASLAHYDAQLDFNDAGYLPRNSLNELRWTSHVKVNDRPAESSVAAIDYGADIRYSTNDRGVRLPATVFLTREASFRRGGAYLLEYQWRPPGYDDEIARGAGNVWRPSRHWFFANYVSPRRNGWHYESGIWILQEGLGGHALQWEGRLVYSFSDRLSLDAEVNARSSRDWLVWKQDDQLARYERSLWDTSINLDWFPRARHELRAKVQWFAVSAHDGRGYRLGQRGRLHPDGSADDFSVNNFGLQLRYRYELAPQSDFYAVYSRGGFERRDDHDNGLALFRDAVSLRDADQFLVKLRYRF
ncbi:DUF5916 domain-containing protein [Tahibacter amnicola]|uniref:DUF5916 domain-containing protein n=1 Tax=Tahibacter amnicola TaxID=2976241 RepID=A0ABY6BGT2_9GAMM|nr:DUF5916 domain-containing protein [Tahibacter amnicola]UXI69229.1 DUF5916 domain-containing protein [Tahibacter amnicola]